MIKLLKKITDTSGKWREFIEKKHIHMPRTIILDEAKQKLNKIL